MSDRELLERAAKAAGYTLKWGDVYMVGGDEVDCSDQPYVVSGQPDEADWYWDPLNDDGDALRLAVALGLVVDCSRPSAGEPFKLFHFGQDGADDLNAATRRAIVRAAAEIGGE